MKVTKDGGLISGHDRPDPDVIRALWHTHRRWVAAILLAHKPREADLEDLLQEVAMSLVRNVHTLNDPASIRPWLRTVAVNAARTAGRKATVRRKAEFRLVGDVDDMAPEEQMRRRESRDEAERVMEAARQLPEAYREPLLLRAVRGMSYRQIADVLDIPLTTVETRLTRARRMLREQLDAEEQQITSLARDADERGEHAS